MYRHKGREWETTEIIERYGSWFNTSSPLIVLLIGMAFTLLGVETTLKEHSIDYWPLFIGISSSLIGTFSIEAIVKGNYPLPFSPILLGLLGIIIFIEEPNSLINIVIGSFLWMSAIATLYVEYKSWRSKR